MSENTKPETGQEVGSPPDAGDVFAAAHDAALAYRASLPSRSHRPAQDYRQMCDHFREPVPEDGRSGSDVIRELAERADPGLMSMAGPRFFGWVLGGSDPVGVAADWLVSAWGQNTGYHTPTPSTSAIEQVAAGWLTDILGLPAETSVGFATGATVANMVALAAARGRVLQKHGWDVEAAGLFGAPEIHVFLGRDAHTSIFSSLSYIGLGTARAVQVATDDSGRMIAADLADAMQARQGPKIVIAQAGQINTGAFDPFDEIVTIAHAHDAWVHVDAAFGLWARASARHRHLTVGLERADSWATDGHKWLQVPFDCGYVFVRDREAHRKAMVTGASYLPSAADDDRVPSDFVPELSRRARAVPTWAMIKTLGRRGIEQLVDRHCRIAGEIARTLAAEPGVEILNDVVLNQVIVAFGGGQDTGDRADKMTADVIAAVQAGGECFVAGAQWHGRWVMRISVICGATTEQDAARSCTAILDAWRQVRTASASIGE
jgi:glutamate/tyrosine decarboxylase-like PLP-dependent enzyme